MKQPFLYKDDRDGRKWKVALPDIKYQRCDDIEKRVAQLLANGKIVGFFTGGCEFGPRALGHRSILADPRNPKMQDILNDKVKHRQWFRPFAPAVLEERAKDYFDLAAPSPHMLLVARVKQEMISVIPSVTHIDKTARVQTVADDGGAFRKVIEEFYAITGVAVVLNTSFNDNGEPIVETPLDAFTSFTSTMMDALALGPFLVTKEGVDG